MTTFRVAAAQYHVESAHCLVDIQQKWATWVKTAHEHGAQVLLFPEYAALELCSLLPATLQADLHQQLHAIQMFLPKYLETHQQLAQQYNVLIVAGSFPVCLTTQKSVIFVNRCYVCLPDGSLTFQDKQIMTRFETEDWLISAGDGVKVFDTPWARMGISICYDSEFPLIARRQVELGAEVILVPSVTETLHGYHRVKIGSQARALENQCYVVHAPLVGSAPWSPAIDISRGAAGVYTPVDSGFPENGILVQGELDQPCWVYADLDLAKIRHVRQQGNVLNHRDWALQTPRINFTD